MPIKCSLRKHGLFVCKQIIFLTLVISKSIISEMKLSYLFIMNWFFLLFLESLWMKIVPKLDNFISPRDPLKYLREA